MKTLVLAYALFTQSYGIHGHVMRISSEQWSRNWPSCEAAAAEYTRKGNVVETHSSLGRESWVHVRAAWCENQNPF